MRTNADRGHLLVATPGWQSTFPGAIAAAVAFAGVANPAVSAELDAAKRALEAGLRDRWNGATRADLRANPILALYDAYYRRFGQTYHVLMQIESIALKGKAIPSRAALVEAMFMAELETGILTAVHDLDRVSLPVAVEATTGEETYTRYDGVEERCKPGDQAMRDAGGILTSIIQGPTAHARVTPETTAALFCLYAPVGIARADVERHLDIVERNVRLVSPASEIVARTVLEAS